MTSDTSVVPATPEPELDTDPDLDSPFKRRLALAVSILALAAGALGWAATDAGIRSAEVSRHASTDSTRATLKESSQAVEAFTNLERYTAAAELRSRGDLGTIQRELLGASAGPVTPQQWQVARKKLERLTPLLRQGRFLDRPDLLANDRSQASNVARLRYEAQKRQAGGWDSKASLYIGGVTLLGVATTLLGLALTVPAGSRRYLVGAATTVAALTAVGSAVVALKPVHDLPMRAIESSALGDRLTAEKDYAPAVAAYAEAIRADPDFAPAYAGRAYARMLRDSPQRGLATYTFTTTTPEARRAAIADLARGIQLEPHDYPMLVNEGANYFHVGNYAETVAFSKRAIIEAPGLPIPWMNEALGLAGENHAERARTLLKQAVIRIRARPLAQERVELFSDIRGTLATLADQRPNLGRLVRSLQEQVTAAESDDLVGKHAAAMQASVSHMTLSTVGEYLHVSFAYAHLPSGSPLAWVVSFRPRGSAEWIERSDMSAFLVWGGATSGAGVWDRFDTACMTDGAYRVDLYSGGHFLATVALPVSASLSGPLQASWNLGASIVLCRPAGWKQLASSSWAADVRSADSRIAMSVRTLVLIKRPAEGAASKALVKDVIARLAKPLGGRPVGLDSPQGMGNWPGTERKIDLGSGHFAEVWASLGQDGFLRTVVIRYDAAHARAIQDLRFRLTMPLLSA
jgi:tetratricopeptide (TPR) repeat protein